jgi:hypothetical protein
MYRGTLGSLVKRWNKTQIKEIISPLMVEAVSTSGSSVNFYETTRRSFHEDSHLLTQGRFQWRISVLAVSKFPILILECQFS